MKKIFRALLILLSIIITSIAIAWAFIDWSRFNNYVSTQIKLFLAEHNVPLRFEKANLSIYGLGFSSLILTPHLSPVSFRIDELKIESTPWQLLRSNPNLRLLADLYQGKIETTLMVSRGDLIIPEIQATQINLTAHSVIHNLGLTEGLLNASAKNISLSSSGEISGDGDINISQITIPSETQVFIPGLPFQIKLRPLQNGTLSSPFKLAKDKVIFPSISFNSSWGTIRGALFLTLGRIRIAEGTILQLQLTQDGLDTVGIFLMSMCNLGPEKIKVGYELQVQARAKGNGTVICR